MTARNLQGDSDEVAATVQGDGDEVARGRSTARGLLKRRENFGKTGKALSGEYHDPKVAVEVGMHDASFG